MAILLIDNEQNHLKDYAKQFRFPDLPSISVNPQLLQQEESIISVSDLKTGLDVFLANPASIRIMILCETYGDVDAVQVMQQLHQSATLPHIIVVTRPSTVYTKKIELMKSGAADLFDSSGHFLELMIAVKQAKDKTIILENINRELSFSTEIQVKKHLETVKDFVKSKQDDTIRQMMPEDIYVLMLDHFKGEMPARKPCVLVVDDEKGMRDLITKILQKDFEVACAQTGDEAEAILMGNPGKYDLMLLDIAMPGQSGEKWVSRFLSLEPGLSIAMVTGFTDDTKLIVDSIRRGAKEYISKPFSVRKLIDKATQMAQVKLLQDELFKAWDVKRSRH